MSRRVSAVQFRSQQGGHGEHEVLRAGELRAAGVGRAVDNTNQTGIELDYRWPSEFPELPKRARCIASSATGGEFGWRPVDMRVVKLRSFDRWFPRHRGGR